MTKSIKKSNYAITYDTQKIVGDELANGAVVTPIIVRGGQPIHAGGGVFIPLANGGKWEVVEKKQAEELGGSENVDNVKRSNDTES